MSSYYYFPAAEAVAYADLYRRYITQTLPVLQRRHGVLEAEIKEGGTDSLRTWTEMAALDHAIAFVGNRRDPDVIVLGDPAQDPVRIAQAQQRHAVEEAKKCTLKLEGAERQLKSSEARIRELELESKRKGQEILRLQQKMSATSSSVTVLGVLLVVVILGALLVLGL